MADMPVFLLALLTVGGGGTVLATQANTLSAGAQRAEQAAAFRTTPTESQDTGKKQYTVIRSDEDGLFHVDAMVNGARIHFLIDTGSNMVVLSPQDAVRAGIAPGGATVSLNTAVGSTSSVMTRIDRMTVAGRELQDITTANFDFIQQYRPLTNVVRRPTAGGAGTGFAVTGHHELNLPLLSAFLLCGD